MAILTGPAADLETVGRYGRLFFHGWGGGMAAITSSLGLGRPYKENISFNWWRSRFFAYGGQYFDENMKPLINTKPGIRALWKRW